MIFFFHLRTADGVERDEVGVGLDSIEAAYLCVCETIPIAAAELLRAHQDPMACAFLIHDEAGRLLMEVPFTELVAARPADVRTAPLVSDRANGLGAESRDPPIGDDERRRLLEQRSLEIAERIQSFLAPVTPQGGAAQMCR